ncbi:serine hydrolase domain-containing protein [Capillimicrobium parvum]|uniref:D-alanyl-D-alanine carboxypeptidase n=1 Tax=Capillimicrobium parvum TaxID=2884022 RepID=A0A9E6XZB8_9ACTN|nr:serine hydrolase domain-containing protein [Capillimicrobium parvum]UGS36546.1 D-alanyl-D-alanine carboxypeptidase [Capillimicrobium parvum]
MPPRLLVVAALAVAAAISPAAATAATPKQADRALGRALGKVVRMPGGAPGAVAVIQRGSQRTVVRRGVADTRTGRPIDVNDRWRIASVSKAFSGATALALVAQGKLSVDDTIAQRLPGLPAAWGSVTLGQALHHTSGLPDFINAPSFRAAIEADARQTVEPSTIIGYVADEPLEFAPGSKYVYSDTDNIVVGLFIEAASGLSYDRALGALVLDPLALRRTSLPMGWRMVAPFVHGYFPNGSPDAAEDASELLNPTIAWASGGMVSSPLDLTRFVRAYASGRLYPGAPVTAQRQFVPGGSGPPGPGVNEAGLGIFRYRTRCGTVLGHTGNYAGYTTFIAATPDGRRSAVVQVSTQLSQALPAPASTAYRSLRRAWGLAVCAAMAK